MCTRRHVISIRPPQIRDLIRYSSSSVSFDAQGLTQSGGSASARNNGGSTVSKDAARRGRIDGRERGESSMSAGMSGGSEALHFSEDNPYEIPEWVLEPAAGQVSRLPLRLSRGCHALEPLPTPLNPSGVLALLPLIFSSALARPPRHTCTRPRLYLPLPPHPTPHPCLCLLLQSRTQSCLHAPYCPVPGIQRHAGFHPPPRRSRSRYDCPAPAHVRDRQEHG